MDYYGVLTSINPQVTFYCKTEDWALSLWKPLLEFRSIYGDWAPGNIIG